MSTISGPCLFACALPAGVKHLARGSMTAISSRNAAASCFGVRKPSKKVSMADLTTGHRRNNVEVFASIYLTLTSGVKT